MYQFQRQPVDHFPPRERRKQGCPLSMLLYALVTETIGKAIDNDSNIRFKHRRYCDPRIKRYKKDTKLLGIIFVPDFDESRNLNWERLCTTIKAKTKSLSQRRLSYKGKAKLINSLIFLKASHVCRVFSPTKRWISDR